MRRTRFITWFFLALSLGFFLLRDFRVALEMPLLNWAAAQFRADQEAEFLNKPPPQKFPWVERRFTLERYVSPEELRRRAEAGDARLKAFAALHLPREEMGQDILRFADQAIAADPELTWVIFSLYSVDDPFAGPGASAGQVWARVERLEAFDPDNAVPHLLRARLLRAARGDDWPSPRDDDYVDALAAQAEWRQAMQAAYASPRYDPYDLRRFQLETAVFRQQGWDHPAVVWFTKLREPFRPLLFIREYGNFLTQKLGPEAEAAGRLDEALEHYWQAWLFGERMRGQAQAWMIEALVGEAIQGGAVERLVPALRQAGRRQGAAAVELAWTQLQENRRRRAHEISLAQTRSNWSALWVNVSAGCWALFLLFTLACNFYLYGKRWLRPQKQGRLYRTMMVAQNYAPVFLFVSGLVLYVSFLPYAQTFAHYMTLEEPLLDLEGLIRSALPVWDAPWFG
ncbi:hypothetical protein MYX77_04225 [Acidobacteriia bacterium AH_259_A11_L15]|nr:hypothetical protein [Acidobacteriia bacterium AH_259_A11_L15]